MVQSYGINNYYPKASLADTKNAIRYSRGLEPIGDELSLSNSIKSIPMGVGCFAAINSIIYTVSNFKNLWNGFGTTNGGFFESLKKSKEAHIASKSFSEQYLNRFTRQTTSKIEGLIKDAGPEQQKKLQKLLRKAQSAKSTKVLTAIEKRVDSLKTAIETAKPAATGILGKTIEFFKKPFKAIGNTKTWQALSKTSVGKFLIKGGAIPFAILETGISLFTEVIPAFAQGGITGGIKQLGKTGANVVASVSGWIAGEAVGAPLGAAIGSFFGPIGAMIGGFIGGVAGGFILSDQAKRLVQGVLGKSVVEEIESKQLNQEAVALMNTPGQLNQLAEINRYRAMEELNTDPNSIAAKEAVKFYNKIKSVNNNPFV